MPPFPNECLLDNVSEREPDNTNGHELTAYAAELLREINGESDRKDGYYEKGGAS